MSPPPHARPHARKAREEHGYLAGRTPADGLIYYVHHSACSPRPEGDRAVLLVGAMGLERGHSHLVWVRWARHLAQRGLDVLRFDYRGVGESTGEHADTTIDSGVDDLARAHELLAERHPRARIALHGLRGGALLAAHAFGRRFGQDLLLWEPPPSARAMLLETLRHKLAADFAHGTGGARRTRADYIAALESDEHVEVDGYAWSRALWDSSLDFPLVLPRPHETRGSLVVYLDGRERVGRSAVEVPRPPFWGESRWLNPDLADLFHVSTTFLERT